MENMHTDVRVQRIKSVPVWRMRNTLSQQHVCLRHNTLEVQSD